MPTERLITNRPGRRTKLIYEDGRPVFVMEQAADPILDYAARKAAETAHAGRQIGSQNHRRHIAELPQVIYFDLLKRFGTPQNNPSDWKRWFNDPENAGFRVHGGHV
jgi:hypothetical protein